MVKIENRNFTDSMRHLVVIKPILIVFLASLLLTASCDHRRNLDKIEEALLSGQIDSALTWLESIDTSMRMSEVHAAKYPVVRTLANTKIGVEDSRLTYELDSLSVWYMSHGSRKDKMLFWFYYGWQLGEAGRGDEAVVSYARALDFARKREDWFYCGMASREISLIFRDNFISSKELEYARLSYDYFSKTDKVSHTAYSSYSLARALYNAGRLDDSRLMFDHVIENAELTRDTSVLYGALMSSSKAYLIGNKMNPRMAYDRLRYALDLKGSLLPCSWADLAYASCLLGEESESKDCLSMAYSICESAHDSLYVMSRKGDCEAVFEGSPNFSADYVDMLNDMVTGIADNSVLNVLNEYYRSQSELEREKKSRMVLLFVLLFLLLVVGVLLVVLSFLSRDKKSLLVIQELRGTIDSLENKTCPGTVMRYSMRMFDPVFNEYCHGGDINGDNLLESFKRMLRGFKEDKAMRNEFSNMVDGANDNVITMMRERGIYRDEEVFLYSMCVSGLSYFAIAAILGIDNVGVAKRVSRLKDKIKRKSTREIADGLLVKMPARK